MGVCRYAAPFRDEVQTWLKRLGIVGECVEGWLSVQSLWMYMEAVFSGGDIVKQLPAEAKRFQAIDKSFMRVRALLWLALRPAKAGAQTCCGAIAAP